MNLVRSVHDALNATATPRTPDPRLLPPRASGSQLLPQPLSLTAPLATTLASRRSSYSFGARRPSLAELGTLLRLGVGSAPRAGGLASVVPYLVARDAGEPAAGVHRVDLRLPLPHLVTVRAGDPTPYVAASIDQPPFATRAPVWVALAVDLGLTLRSYPPRHYRTLHLDAGASLQNVLLVATALGLATCPVMGYDDRAWADLLDLPDDQILAVVVATGYASG